MNRFFAAASVLIWGGLYLFLVYLIFIQPLTTK